MRCREKVEAGLQKTGLVVSVVIVVKNHHEEDQNESRVEEASGFILALGPRPTWLRMNCVILLASGGKADITSCFECRCLN